MAEPLVDVSDLGRRYGRRTAVQGVTLRLLPGEVVGLVGANGGGKTTTLRMLAGLIRPDRGGGTVLGVPLASRDTAHRARIGYMPQSLSLYPELTVEENLRFRLRTFGLGDMRRRLDGAADRWGLGPVMRRPFAQLSGGWGRRAQFAATMLPSPALLLLDEPTAGLDVVTRGDIWRWLGEAAAAGCGVVVSTHDLAEAERCPALIHYQDGAAEGPLTPAALIARTAAPSLAAAVAHLAGEAP